MDGHCVERSAHGRSSFHARLRGHPRALRHRLQKRERLVPRSRPHPRFPKHLHPARLAKSPGPRLGFPPRPLAQQLLHARRRPPKIRAHNRRAPQTFRPPSTKRPSAHGLLHPHLLRAVAGDRMKIVYNWLKDFVDVKATPDELASRLALSGTNIGSIENGPHGAVIDAEVSSNRPDCLGHYGIAREVSAIFNVPLKPVTPR